MGHCESIKGGGEMREICTYLITVYLKSVANRFLQLLP